MLFHTFIVLITVKQMRHDTRATYFKAHLYSLDCCKYTNYLSIRILRKNHYKHGLYKTLHKWL